MAEGRIDGIEGRSLYNITHCHHPCYSRFPGIPELSMEEFVIIVFIPLSMLECLGHGHGFVGRLNDILVL